MKILSVLKRYRWFLAFLALSIIITIINPQLGIKSYKITWDNTLDMLSALPPVFVLIGLLDVWISRETMIKYMGEGSGTIGVIFAFLIGSIAAGPLYAAFPIAGILLKKGSKLSNVFIMIGAWSTTKIPQLLFEISSLGLKFTLIRLGLDLLAIAAIAIITEKFLTKTQKENIYSLSNNL